MNLFSSILSKKTQTTKTLLKKHVNRWLSRRVPSNFRHKLSNRNIFIMPTRFGFAYLLFDILLFLLGTNYQNNIILLLSYLLASLFITVMMHSFYNFSQLIFSSSAKQFTFAKQLAYFPINIHVDKARFDLNFHFVEQGSLLHTITLERCGSGESKVLLPFLANHRGVFNVGRVKVFSEYSLGLFITWTMLDFSHQLVVFPQQKKFNSNHHYLTGLDEQGTNISQQTSLGVDDFDELKNYVAGESPARIAWKQLARGQGKLSKHYQNQQGSLLWLKLTDMPSSDIETKLSFLCFLILEYSSRELEFGLLLDLASHNLQTVKIMPNCGYQHQQNCLITLAELKFNVVG
ncbi:MAG: DUF58 domain-containing protein [Colwellia sp.]|nr:DUF58 domain-containing protein [Colwellia sp.]